MSAPFGNEAAAKLSIPVTVADIFLAWLVMILSEDREVTSLHTEEHALFQSFLARGRPCNNMKDRWLADAGFEQRHEIGDFVGGARHGSDEGLTTSPEFRIL